jgi:hypothetical protein
MDTEFGLIVGASHLADSLRNSHVWDMPKAAKCWTCDVCGETMANSPMIVLGHIIKHVERRPFATSTRPQSADGAEPGDEAARPD